MSDTKDFLLKKIADLEAKLSQKNNELAVFQQEFTKINGKIELLVAKMKGELNALQKIQHNLIPTEFPTIPGFEFSSKFIAGSEEGGDYFDIISQVDKSKFGILIASCSSYIVSALLMATLMRKLPMIQVSKGADPNQILTEIIESLQDGLEDGQSIDILYGVFDRKKFEFNFTLLGDIFAAHQNYAEKELKLLDGKFKSLTQSSHYELSSKTVKLNPRDRIVFLTKGAYLVEGLKPSQGKEKLMSHLQSGPRSGAHEIRNFLSYSLQNKGPEKKPKRDVTMVVAEVKDHVIKLA